MDISFILAWEKKINTFWMSNAEENIALVGGFNVGTIPSNSDVTLVECLLAESVTHIKSLRQDLH